MFSKTSQSRLSLQIAMFVGSALLFCSARAGLTAESDDLAAEIERADENGNGALDPDELKELPSEIRERLSQQGVTFDEEISLSQVEQLLQPPVPSSTSSTPSVPAGAASQGGASAATGTPAVLNTSSGSVVLQSSGLSAAAALQARGISTVKPRVTTPLPSTHLAADTNSDGQIGLYEWRAWKGRSGLAEFFRYDRDGDGFVTPREIALGPLPLAVPAAISSTSTSGSSASPGAALSSVAASVPSSTGSSPNAEQAELAKKYYGMLDKDRNGKISQDEWQISKRIRSAFEQGKVDLNNMNESDFVGHYVRLLGNSPR